MPTCAICGGSTQTPLQFGLRATDVDESFRLEACSACGVLRTLPVPDDLARFYDTELGRSVRSVGSPVFAVLQRWLLRAELARIERVDGPQRFVDVGCGSGSFARLLHQRGLAAITADATAEPPPLTRGLSGVPHHVVDFERGEIEGLDPGARYTMILRHVVEHAKDPPAFLRRLIAQGGRRFYLACPNAASLERRLLGRYWYLWDPPRHLWHFDARSLRALCEGVGLEVVATGWDTIPNLVPSAYRLLCLKDRFPRGRRLLHPRGALASLCAPLNLLAPRNVVWLVARAH